MFELEQLEANTISMFYGPLKSGERRTRACKHTNVRIPFEMNISAFFIAFFSSLVLSPIAKCFFMFE
jgi:hypothetical protein